MTRINVPVNCLTSFLMDPIVYLMRTPETTRPFYFYPNKGVSRWILINGYQIVEPPDGFITKPPKSLEHKKNQIVGTSNIKARTISQITNLQKGISSIARTILGCEAQHALKLTSTIPTSFFSLPFLPFDLFALDDASTLYKNLEILMTPAPIITKKGQVEKFDFEQMITPSKGNKTPPFFNQTPTTLVNASKSLYKAIKKYISSSSEDSLVEMINIIDANIDRILPEATLQLIAETNSIYLTSEIDRAWVLMLIFTAKYKIPEPFLRSLRSYLLIIAGHEEVEKPIREKAHIALLRASSLETAQFEFNTDVPQKFVNQCCNMNIAFGVTLEELLYKEKIKFNTDFTKVPCIPMILRRMVAKLNELGATETTGVLRINGNISDVTIAKDQIDKGEWEIEERSIHTVSSLLKNFIGAMADPLIPSSIIKGVDVKTPTYKCIALANSLPNAHRDTLKLLIWFLQNLLDNVTITQMTIQNVCVLMGHAFMRIPQPDKYEELIVWKQTTIAARDRYLSCLVDSWDTSDICTI